jgi:ligand-binding sensor domain-containing protein
MAVDIYGNTWIATMHGGLAKFDGTNWTIYNSSNSGLPNNSVLSIAIDGDGNKWIGTYEGGFVKFDGTNWITYNISNSGLPDNTVVSIAIDGNGNKWIGTYYGLTKFDGTKWITYNISNSGLPCNIVVSIAIDDNDNKWIGTANGMAVFKEGGFVSVEEEQSSKSKVPNQFLLNQNYPNPFNPSTTISYQIPEKTRVTLTVFNISGQEVNTLVNNIDEKGYHSVVWDGTDSSGKKVASGIYFYKLNAGNFSKTQKMTFMR